MGGWWAFVHIFLMVVLSLIDFYFDSKRLIAMGIYILNIIRELPQREPLFHRFSPFPDSRHETKSISGNTR